MSDETPVGTMNSTSDIEAFKESLVAAARGPFFPDWEFQTLFGLDRTAVDAIADSFSPTTPIKGDVALAINNSIVNLLGYPHDQHEVWSQWLTVTPDELRAIFARWKAARSDP